MQVPVTAATEHVHPDVERIKCAMAERPNRVDQHRKEMLRWFVLIIALLAVAFLMAIALYYTQGNSVSIEHVSSLSPAVLSPLEGLG